MWDSFKRSLVNLAAFIVFFFIAIAILGAFLSQSSQVGGVLSGVLLFVAVIGVKLGEPKTKFRIAAVALIGASIVGLMSHSTFRDAENLRAEKEQKEMLSRLRQTDPKQYLDLLRKSDPTRFLDEARLLDPPSYEIELKLRDEARRAEIERIKADVGKASDARSRMSSYSRLLELDPSNSDFRKQRDALQV